MDNNQQRKWQGRSSAGSLANNGLKLLMRCVPIKVSYVLLYAVVPFYMLFARKGYLSIFRFYRKRFEVSPFKAFFWTFKNHYIFGQTLLDKFAAYAGKSNFLKFEFNDKQLIDNAIADHKGTLLASSHVGNFEISGYFLKSDNKTINSIIYGGEQQVVQSNRERVLRRQNVNLIPVQDDMSHIFAIGVAARSNEIISIPCDRYFPGSKSGELDFMGVKTRFPVGAFHIAKKFDLNVLTIFVVKINSSTYRAILHPIDNQQSPLEMAQSYARLLEQIVREYPWQWFNFYDFFDEK